MTYSKTAAIKIAQMTVGSIIRQSSTSYCYYTPYRTATEDDLRGPSTEVRADSYPKIVASRAQSVARIALMLIGHVSADEYDEVDYMVYQRGPMSARSLVDAVIHA